MTLLILSFAATGIKHFKWQYCKISPYDIFFIKNARMTRHDKTRYDVHVGLTRPGKPSENNHWILDRGQTYPPPPPIFDRLRFVFQGLFLIDWVFEYGMKNILWTFWFFFTIETQTYSWKNVDKYEVRGEIYRVKLLLKHAIYWVRGEHKLCFGASLSHTNRFEAWRKKT